jgi:hypothetical protein
VAWLSSRTGGEGAQALGDASPIRQSVVKPPEVDPVAIVWVELVDDLFASVEGN